MYTMQCMQTMNTRLHTLGLDSLLACVAHEDKTLRLVLFRFSFFENRGVRVRPSGRQKRVQSISTAHCEIKAVSRGVTLSTHTCRWLTFPAGLTGGRVNRPASKSLQECAACRTDASRTASLASPSQQSLWMSTAFLPHPLLTSFSPK